MHLFLLVGNWTVVLLPSTHPLFSVGEPLQIKAVCVAKGLGCLQLGNWDEFLCSFEPTFRASNSIFTRTREMVISAPLLSMGLQRIKYQEHVYGSSVSLHTACSFDRTFNSLPCFAHVLSLFFPAEEGWVDHCSQYFCCFLNTFCLLKSTRWNALFCLLGSYLSKNYSDEKLEVTPQVTQDSKWHQKIV